MDNLEPITKGYQIGIDIGQQIDNTAIIVTELQLRDYQRIDPQRGDVTGGVIHYVVRHIERMELRTPYPKVIERLQVIYEATEARTIKTHYYNELELRVLARAGKTPPKPPNLHFACYVDATGVGRPIIDACEEKGMDVYGVTLTGGEKEIIDGRLIRLAKQELVSRMQVVLQNHYVHFPHEPAEQARLSQAVADELLNYEIKVTENANLKMGVFKTGAHDDLATALGLACRPLIENYLTFGLAPDALQDFFGGYSTRD